MVGLTYYVCWPALLSALEVDSPEPYERLESTGLELTESMVDTLLEPRANGQTLWQELLLQQHKRKVIDMLIAADDRLPHPKLRIAALSSMAGSEPSADEMSNEETDSESAADSYGSDGDQHMEMESDEGDSSSL